LVSYLSQGDYFEAYEAGVARQAKALGVDLSIFQGKQDAAQQREQIEQAISLGVQGLIVSHGEPESLKDVVQKALDAGIKVVAKDIDLGNPKVPLISQNDHEIARQVLEQALKDNGTSFPAGYVFVAGFRPLELRGEIWADVKNKNPGIVQKAQWGAVDSNTATTVASQTAAALRANPDIKVVFAPYDEFARGVKLGATEAGISRPSQTSTRGYLTSAVAIKPLLPGFPSIRGNRGLCVSSQTRMERMSLKRSISILLVVPCEFVLTMLPKNKRVGADERSDTGWKPMLHFRPS